MEKIRERGKSVRAGERHRNGEDLTVIEGVRQADTSLLEGENNNNNVKRPPM